MEHVEHRELLQAMLQTGLRMLDGARLINLVHLLMQTNWTEGAAVEFGCYEGSTALVMAHATGKSIHVFDSFEGLPEKGSQDGDYTGFVRGSCAAKQEVLVEKFKAAGLPVPIIHAGWFKDVRPEEMPKVAFAHIDGDFYQSTLDALNLVYPAMVCNGICVVDDVGYDKLPGVTTALDDFLSDLPERSMQLFGPGSPCTQAYFKKL